MMKVFTFFLIFITLSLGATVPALLIPGDSTSLLIENEILNNQIQQEKAVPIFDIPSPEGEPLPPPPDDDEKDPIAEPRP